MRLSHCDTPRFSCLRSLSIPSLISLAQRALTLPITLWLNARFSDELRSLCHKRYNKKTHLKPPRTSALCTMIVMITTAMLGTGCQRSSTAYLPIQHTAHITPLRQKQWTSGIHQVYWRKRRALEFLRCNAHAPGQPAAAGVGNPDANKI